MILKTLGKNSKVLYIRNPISVFTYFFHQVTGTHYIFISVTELILIYLSSSQISKSIFSLIYALTSSKRIAITALTLLFFPGTIIHELSHFLVAKILFLSTGKVSLFPHLQGDSIKLGSVEVERADFVRSFFVGAAPFFGGFGVLIGVVWYIQSRGMMIPFISQQFITYIILGYIFFVIANSMFSSRKDFESMWKLLLIVLAIITLLFFVLGQQHFLESFELLSHQAQIVESMKMLGVVLFFPLVINIVLMVLFVFVRKKFRA